MGGAICLYGRNATLPTYNRSNGTGGTICLHERVSPFPSYDGSDSMGATKGLHGSDDLFPSYNQPDCTLQLICSFRINAPFLSDSRLDSLELPLGLLGMSNPVARYKRLGSRGVRRYNDPWVGAFPLDLSPRRIRVFGLSVGGFSTIRKWCCVNRNDLRFPI